jgi:AraC-like DNA-binding protein
MSIDHNSLGAAHRVRVINYIEENLGDPKLTPTRIAAAFRITTRYLHHLFSEEDETVARYILRRRLEECARALTSPTQRKRTITRSWFQQRDAFRQGIPFTLRPDAERLPATPRRERLRKPISVPVGDRPSIVSGVLWASAGTRRERLSPAVLS